MPLVSLRSLALLAALALGAAPACSDPPPAPPAPPPRAAVQDGPQPEGSAVDLELRLAAGDRFAFESTQTIDNVSRGAMLSETFIEIRQAWALDVETVGEDGVAALRIALGRIHGVMDSPMTGVVSFDSDTPAEKTGNAMLDVIVAGFTAMANTALTARVDRHGEVLDLGGVDEAIESFMERLPDDPLVRGMAAQFSFHLGDAQQRRQVQQVVTALPAEPRRLNERWADEDSIPGAAGAKVGLTQRHVLAAVDEASVRIETEGDVVIDLEGGDVDDIPGGAAAKALLASIEFGEASFTAETTIARADGLPLAASSELRLTMEMPEPGGYGKLEIEQSMKTRLRRVER